MVCHQCIEVSLSLKCWECHITKYRLCVGGCKHSVCVGVGFGNCIVYMRPRMFPRLSRVKVDGCVVWVVSLNGVGCVCGCVVVPTMFNWLRPACCTCLNRLIGVGGCREDVVKCWGQCMLKFGCICICGCMYCSGLNVLLLVGRLYRDCSQTLSHSKVPPQASQPRMKVNDDAWYQRLFLNRHTHNSNCVLVCREYD